MQQPTKKALKENVSLHVKPENPKWKGKNSVKPWKGICMSNDFDDNTASDGCLSTQLRDKQ